MVDDLTAEHDRLKAQYEASVAHLNAVRVAPDANTPRGPEHTPVESTANGGSKVTFGPGLGHPVEKTGGKP